MIYTQCQILYVYSLMLKTWKFSFNENVLYITKQRKSIKHWKYKKKTHTQKKTTSTTTTKTPDKIL